MMISVISPSSSAAAPAIPVPTTREEVARALVAVPGAVIMTAGFGSTRPGDTSRADMLAPVLAKLDVATATGVLDAAIAGVLTLAPEFASQEASLRQAAAGVVALLTEFAADHAVGANADIAKSIVEPMSAVAAPLFHVAAQLVPAPTK